MLHSTRYLYDSGVRVGKRFTLEISVGALEAAEAAERGGADRIELSANLSVGGLTPSRSLLGKVRRKVRIPIFSMIRPRAGNFIYAAAEFEEMKRAIEIAKECGMDGVVLGVLREDRTVAVEHTHELVELAKPLPVTFHRAFDECRDLQQSLEEAIQTGATRVLTSGAAKSALDGVSMLRKLVHLTGNRAIIVPGAGISARNAAEVRGNSIPV